jgi:hypothetical protein
VDVGGGIHGNRGAVPRPLGKALGIGGIRAVIDRRGGGQELGSRTGPGEREVWGVRAGD